VICLDRFGLQCKILICLATGKFSIPESKRNATYAYLVHMDSTSDLVTVLELGLEDALKKIDFQ